MDWKTMLGYVSGSVDEKLLLRNGYSCGRESSSSKSDPGSLAPDRCETSRRDGLESVCVFGHDGMAKSNPKWGYTRIRGASPHLQATVLLECRARMSRISPGLLDTSHAQRPKPPCVLTARTHSSRNRRLVRFDREQPYARILPAILPQGLFPRAGPVRNRRRIRSLPDSAALSRPARRTRAALLRRIVLPRIAHFRRSNNLLLATPSVITSSSASAGGFRPHFSLRRRLRACQLA